MILQRLPGYLRGLLLHVDGSCTRPMSSSCSVSLGVNVSNCLSGWPAAKSTAPFGVYSKSFATHVQQQQVALFLRNSPPSVVQYILENQCRQTVQLSASTCSQSRLQCSWARQFTIRSTDSMCRATPAVRWHCVRLPQSSTTILARRGMATQPRRAAHAQKERLQKKASEHGLYLVAMVIGMVGLTYASVPLYR